MRRLARRAVMALAAVAIVLVPSAGCDEKTDNLPPLVFTAYPTQQPVDLAQSFQPILKMLQKETGREVRFRPASDYNQVFEWFRKEEVDIADVGPLVYVKAKKMGARITAAAARVRAKGEPYGYKSYGITQSSQSSSSIRTLKDFRGKYVCFVDRNSTSGYLYPKAGLLKAGLLKEGMEPEQVMTVVPAERHDEVVRKVANGECDAGFTYERMLDQQVKRRQVPYGRIAVVWESDIIPGAPMVVADKLPKDLRAKLTRALQEKANADYLRANGFCQVQCAIAEGDAYGYVPVDDSFYDNVRKVCKVTGDKSCALDA